MVVFHVSTFILLLHIAGGISFSGIALPITGCAQVRLFIGLAATQLLLATHKWVVVLQASP